MNPSMQDVSAMADIMGALDDVDSGRATQQVNEAIRMDNPASLPDGMQDIAAMKGILTNLYDVAGPELNAPQPAPEINQSQQQQINHSYAQSQYMTEDMSYEEYLAATQGKGLRPADPATGQQYQAQAQPVLNGPEWTIVREAYGNTKALHTYTVQHSLTGSPIMSNIVMRESAAAVLSMLNDGHTFEDPKLLGVISTGVQYTRLIESMLSKMRTRQRVLRESNYQAAADCDTSITKSKADAAKMKSDLLEYLTKHGISHK